MTRELGQPWQKITGSPDALPYSLNATRSPLARTKTSSRRSGIDLKMNETRMTKQIRALEESSFGHHFCWSLFRISAFALRHSIESALVRSRGLRTIAVANPISLL